MSWKKSAGDVWDNETGPFVAKIIPKGDGRWLWTIHSDGKPNHVATGIGNSLGAAKTSCDNFVSRSGRV